MIYTIPLDQHHRQRYIGLAAFNHAASFDRLNTKADKPLPSGFFTSVYTTVAPSLVGRSGDTFGYAGFFRAGRSTLLRACHPHLTVWSGLITPTKGAVMPKLARVLLSHFSFAAVLLAAYAHAPLIVVLLSVITLGLVHLVGGASK